MSIPLNIAEFWKDRPFESDSESNEPERTRIKLDPNIFEKSTVTAHDVAIYF